MENYYNTISTVRRIAFIDKLTHLQAEELSKKYKYAVCFASLEPAPSIWYQGKRYGGTVIDSEHDHVQIGSYSVYLTLDTEGKLGLSSTKIYTEDLLYFIGPIRVLLQYIDQDTQEIRLTDTDVSNSPYWFKIDQFPIRLTSNQPVGDNVIVIPQFNPATNKPIKICAPIYQDEHTFNEPIPDTTIIEYTDDIYSSALKINSRDYNIYQYANENSVFNNLIAEVNNV